jgi:hypothetical protein
MHETPDKIRSHRPGRKPGLGRTYRLALGIAIVCGLGLVSANGALAATNFETVQTFGGLVGPPAEPGKYPEEVQLGGVGGIAINRTGAGGVAPGTLYTIGSTVGEWYISRFSPTGAFELSWNWLSPCGPKAGPSASACPARTTGSPIYGDIEVDQTTGYVYVLNLTGLSAGGDTVRVYSPDGTELITEFAPLAAFGETDTMSPEKVHSVPSNQALAVNGAGEVYIADEDNPSDFHHRLMVFKPSVPGVYTHYVYAGKSNDIAPGFTGTSNAPDRPVTDDAGNIYVAGEEYIEEYEVSEPKAPICTFTKPGAGISSMTVNPANGEVFYYNGKPSDRKIRRLEPCNSEGKLVESQPAFVQSPGRESLTALAFNPTLNCQDPPFAPSVCAEERAPGLLYGATYSGEIGNPQVTTALGYIFAHAPSVKPVVEKEQVSGIASTSATLRAQINPKGSQTSYAFQYLTEEAYEANDPSERFAGAIEAPPGGAPVGAGQEGLQVAASITGLVQGHEYRYRVLATSANGTAFGEAKLFRTFPVEVGGLPDGRAYELVSPAAKNGGEVLPISPGPASCGAECNPGLAAFRFPLQATADGDSIVYQGQPFGFGEGITEYNEYLSRRSDAGWQTAGLAPPIAGENVYKVFGFDPNFTQGLLDFSNPQISTGAPTGYVNIFQQPTDDRLSLTPLLRFEPEHRVPEGEGNAFKIQYAGASSDLSRIFFAANDTLTEETATAPEPEDGGVAKLNLYEWHNRRLTLVNVFPGNTETEAGMTFGSGAQISDAATHAEDFSHAISADGSRVFWSNPASGQVYVRINGIETREIQDPGRYLSASTDGSRVLLNDGCLYEVDAEECVDLTQGEGGFVGLVGQTDSLSHVYFVDQKALTGPNAAGKVPNEGGHEEDNLYTWDEGTMAFIATLSPNDGSGGGGDWDTSEVRRSAQASPNGNWLAFMSRERLTGVDSDGACGFNPDTEKFDIEIPCSEVFLYDAASGSLTCASCNPVGAAPLGPTWLPISRQAEDFIKPSRFLTDQGRLFFNTMDSLSSLDSNRGVADVYEYEPAGVGSCAAAVSCVKLISSGRGSGDSQFATADLSGKNAFFTTRDRLVRADGDGAIDLYDAREGGGIAAQNEAPPVECQGEACQPQATAPNDPTPASSSFEGPGNLAPEGKKSTCPKGMVAVKIKGKKQCKKKHKKKKHKKHARKRAAKHNKGGRK